MATIVGSAAGGNWNTNGAWVGSVQPTAADDVTLTAASGNITIPSGVTALARSLDCTGYLGILTFSATTSNLNVGDASGGLVKFVNTMTLTLTAIGTINFLASTASTTYALTTAGLTMPNLTVNAGTTTTIQFADAVTATGATLTLTQGKWDWNGKTVVAGAWSDTGTSTRTLTMGGSSATFTAAAGWTTNSLTGLTISSSSATITLSGAGATFASASSFTAAGATLVMSGSGQATVNNFSGAGLTRTITAVKTDSLRLSGSYTLTGAVTLNGNSSINRLLVFSNTVGTPRTITAGSLVATNVVEFQDITGAGGATWTTGASWATAFGDCGGNSGITFTASSTQTATGTASFTWSTHGWTTRVPLPQDDVVINNAFVAGRTITADMPRLGRSIDFTGCTGSPTFSNSVAQSIFGSLTLVTGVAPNGTNALTLAGRSTYTLTTAGATMTQAVTVTAPGGTYTLQDAYTTSRAASQTFAVSAGTLNTNNQSVSLTGTTGQVRSFNASALLTCGTTTFTIASTATGTPWSIDTSGTVSAANATIILSAASANTRTFAGNGNTFGTLTYTVAGSTGILLLTGSNKFNTWNFSDATNARNIRLTNGTIQNVQNFTVNGTATKLTTFDTDSAGVAATISKQYADPSGNVWSSFGNARAVAGYLALDGVAGSYASTPDSAALSITGDIDIKVLAALDLWSGAAAIQSLITKSLSTGNQRSWQFNINTDGKPHLIVYPDGTTATQVDVSVPAPGFTNGTSHWLRVTWRASDGRVQFWQADAALVAPTTGDWVQMGTNQTANIGAIFDATSAVELGSSSNGTGSPLTGKVYKAEVRNGIDGTVVANPDFTIQHPNAFNYLSIKDSKAIGSGGWYAGTTSTNVSGNTNWNFSDPVVTGGLATETPTATAGVPNIVVQGSQVVETETANTGAPTLVVVGSQASETTAGSTGAAVVVVGGSASTETNTGITGSPAFIAIGSQAAETAAASVGVPVVTTQGSQAGESTTGVAGSLQSVLPGSNVTETEGVSSGTPAVILAGTQAVETEQAFHGAEYADFVLNGAQTTETDAANVGVPLIVVVGSQVVETSTSVSGTPAVTKSGSLVTETEILSHGSTTIVVGGNSALTTASALSGSLLLVVAGGSRTETTTSSHGIPLVVLSGAATTEADSGFSGSIAMVFHGGSSTELSTSTAGTPNLVVTGLLADETDVANHGRFSSLFVLRERVTGSETSRQFTGNEPESELVGARPSSAVSGRRPSTNGGGNEPSTSATVVVNID